MGQKIVIIVDRAKQHFSAEVKDFLNSFNDSIKPRRVVLTYINEHLTSILQVGDVAFNKPIKDAIVKRYWRFRHDSGEPLSSRFRISRRDMVSIIEDVIAEFNSGSRRDGRVREAFEKCGLNPYVGSLCRFQQHIEQLSVDSIYQAKKNSMTNWRLH